MQPKLPTIHSDSESADQETLSRIGKPITARQVKAAFAKMQTINDRFEKIEVTGNFIPGNSLPVFIYLIQRL